jgi:micrococcal nuclease
MGSALYAAAGIAALLAIGTAWIGYASPHVQQRSVMTASGAVSVLPATTTPNVYPVSRVVDGDTIDVLMNDKSLRIRIIGLDTPEIVDPRKVVQCFAKQASDEGHALLDGQYVRLEYDPSQGVKDKYGRTLAYVFMMNGTSYEEFMIENGYGHEYTYNLPYKYQSQFKAAQKQAQNQKKGFWADDACAGNTTKPASAG